VVLSGEISVRELIGSSEAEWFERYYEQAVVRAVAELRTPELSILGFIGTWCGDTHVLLPAFVKAMDLSGVSRTKLQLIALGRDKKGPQTERFQITRLPTFVLLYNGREVGRITESPETTLCEDLERILRRQ
jgi:hypothetical protein